MNCRLCHSKESTGVFSAPNVHGRHLWDKEERFLLRRCLHCQAVYIDGLDINDDYYRKYYPADYYEAGLAPGFLKKVMDCVSRASFKSKERLILRFVRPKPGEKLKVLDLGCGSGDFLNSLDAKIFQKYGIEINPRGYQDCLKKQIHAFNQDIKAVDFKDEFFDCVTLWHVIEHLENPHETLGVINRILKKDGILVIATPNTDNLGFRWGKDLWFHLDAPRHLVLFGEKSLKFILTESGFRDIARAGTFYDYPLDLFWSLRKSFLRFFVYPIYPLFKLISPETVLFISRKR